MRGAGVLRAPGRGVGVRGRGRPLRAGGGVRGERVRGGRAPRRVQALQPAAGRDVRVRARRPRVPLRGRAGVAPPARVGVPRGRAALALLAGGAHPHQVLGQVHGVPAGRPRARHAAARRRHLQLEQGTSTMM